jgi:hypothetical protein
MSACSSGVGALAQIAEAHTFFKGHFPCELFVHLIHVESSFTMFDINGSI